MRNLMAKDGVLKIISVVLAILIWIYVITVLEPTTEVTVRDVPIQYAGYDVLSQNGLSVVSESDTSVNVKIKGSRKRLGNYDMKSVVAKVDLSEITEEGNHSLPVTVVVPFENDGVTSKTPYSVDVVAEKTTKKKFDIQIDTVGNMAGGYMPGDITLDSNTVEISGGASVIEQITRASVELNYNNADVDIDAELPIKLYGVDGTEILPKDALYTRIQKDRSKVMLHCAVLKVKEVDVDLVLSNDSISLSEFELSPSQIYIYGEDAATRNVQSIKTEVVSVEELLSKEKVKVKLQVPSGVKVIEDIYEVSVSLSDNSTLLKMYGEEASSDG